MKGKKQLKTLKNQSKSKILLKAKIKNFITKELWQYCLVTGFIAFCGWLFAKPIEAVCFWTSHLIIRPEFAKQYHCRNRNLAKATACCLFVTFSVIFFGILYCMPLSISLLASIPLAFVICWVGYVAQDNLDMRFAISGNIYLMTDKEFETFCISKGLTEMETSIADKMFRKKLKGEELYSAIGYCKRQTLRIRSKLRQILFN